MARPPKPLAGYQVKGTRLIRDDAEAKKREAQAHFNREALQKAGGVGDYIPQSVRSHVRKRFDRTARLYVLVEKSLRHGLITSRDDLHLITRGSTTVQAFQADERGFHSAHLLPCQPLFGGHAPWELSGASQTYQRIALDLYDETTNEPAIINMVENFIDNAWKVAEDMVERLNEIRRGRPPEPAFDDWRKKVVAVLNTQGPRYAAEMATHVADAEEAIGLGTSVSRQMYTKRVVQVIEAYQQSTEWAERAGIGTRHLQSATEFSRRMDQAAQPAPPPSSGSSSGST